MASSDPRISDAARRICRIQFLRMPLVFQVFIRGAMPDFISEYRDLSS
jgi:hypothetical protein